MVKAGQNTTHWEINRVTLARRNGLVRIWVLFIGRNCDILLQTDTEAQLHRLPAPFPPMHAWKPDCAESAGSYWRGNLVMPAEQRSAVWPGSSRPLTHCHPSIMLRRPDVTLYSLTAHAHTIVQLCGQIHPPQISNSDIRLKEIINDTLSDVFLRS